LDGKTYPYDLNKILFSSLYDEYYDWLEENKEKLGLTED